MVSTSPSRSVSLQGRELPAAGAGIGGQPGEQQRLLGPMQGRPVGWPRRLPAAGRTPGSPARGPPVRASARRRAVGCASRPAGARPGSVRCRPTQRRPQHPHSRPTVGSGHPCDRQSAQAAASTFGVRSTARLSPTGSWARNPTTDRYPTTVDGRHPWSAHSHSRRSAASVMPGRVRPDDRTSSAFAAHRSLAACADSRSPCTVNDRYRDRPLTGSGPTATRTSHTPGRRCRIDPLPRASLMSATVRTTIDTPTGVSRGRRSALNGMVNGMRSCTKITRNSRNGCGATDLGSAPGGIRTPTF